MYRILSAGRQLAVLVFALGAASLAEATTSIASVTPTPTLPPPPSSTPTQPWPSSTPTCGLIPGYLGFRSVTVAPLHPLVGDQVTIQFDYNGYYYSLRAFTLDGAEGLLDGSRVTTGRSFELSAVSTGLATVTISGAYNTEYDCNGVYSPGPYTTVHSQPLTFDIAAPLPHRRLRRAQPQARPQRPRQPSMAVAGVRSVRHNEASGAEHSSGLLRQR
ncbi:MAG: hypothetical protein ACHQ9S_25480 [Candidatus Binatia bacterium]